jgi:hypothetical protein
MAVRQFIAKQLSNAAQAVSKDQSKENVGKAVLVARAKLATWIAPKPKKMIR